MEDLSSRWVEVLSWGTPLPPVVLAGSVSLARECPRSGAARVAYDIWMASIWSKVAGITLGLLWLTSSASGADLTAGVAREVITPKLPIWLTGFASRTRPANDGKLHDLHAKALAVDDGRGGRIVLVTVDLLGLPPEVIEPVTQAVKKQHGLERSQILFNSSHTHSGPVVWPAIPVLFDFKPDERAAALGYQQELIDKLTRVIGEAWRSRVPAELSWGQGQTDFASNRRAARLKSTGQPVVAPVDHSVPAIRVSTRDGKVLAAVFGYACHNTTITGENYEVNGDYAGFAQLEFEKIHPGAMGMFLMLCGADQNPEPRGRIPHAERHGRVLAEEVSRVIKAPMQQLNAPLKTSFRTVQLEFAPHTRETFEAESRHKDKYRVRRAKLMLEAYDAGKPVRELTYPVQGLRFGDDLTILALSGEVVLDYTLRLRKEFPHEKLISSGYNNDVVCYIPSKRVLKEGGYEAVDSMIYYAQPGPFRDDVEDRIFGAIRRLMRDLGVR
jgi:neutral ceramidase